MRLDRKDCPMRHENGNCTAAGGFCTAVNDSICEALHNAFNCGEQHRIEWATLVLAEQARLYEEKTLDALRKIHAEVTTQGVIIPCKMGDTAYGIRNIRGHLLPMEGIVSEIYFTNDMQLVVALKNVSRGVWGERIFPTCQDAEARIREEMRRRGAQ